MSLQKRKSSHRNNNNENILAASTCPTVPTHIKGVFCGSGSDAMNDPRITNAILSLVDQNKPLEQVNVLYLGTATYDIQGFFIRQTQRFAEAGCQVQALKVAGTPETADPDEEFMSPEERLEHYHHLIDTADVLVVGGGNTLFALDRWRKLGLVPALQRAALRGAVLTGGSAGAICWFDAGHSNSADPMTYKKIRIQKFAHRSPEEIVDEIYSYKSDTSTEGETDSDSEDEDMADSSDSDDDMSDDESTKRQRKPTNNKSNNSNSKPWEYFRVAALGFLPGLVSPHLDRVQSNGVLRAHDFDKCLLQHPGEAGIGIDHFAALIVDGPHYRVLSLTGKEGTVKNGSEFVEDGSGEPGVWLKQVVDEKVVSRVCPPQGQLKDILTTATAVVEDEDATLKCRQANPDDGWVPPLSIRQ